MTETEWLVSVDPRVMLDHVRVQASPRKLRWFACACVREVWPYMLDARSQHAIEVSERYADGKASVSELATAELSAFEVASMADLRTTVSDPSWAATRAAARAANLDAYTAASGAAFITALCAAPWKFNASGEVVDHGDAKAKSQARRRQCDLLRDILGNPFRTVTVDPRWLTWNHATVMNLANELYQERRFEELPILADALEEAGCASNDILDHLRQQCSHARGCWALDVLLAKS